MTITSTPSTHYEYKKQQGSIDLINDTIKAALMNDTFSFDRNKHKVWSAPNWAASTSYSIEDLLIPTTPNGYIYQVISGETSASSEPSWPTIFGDTVIDNNGMEYECWSYETAYNEIAASGEYTQVTLSVSGEQVSDENGNLAYVNYDDIIFEASGEDFENTSGCVIFDDTDNQNTIIAGIEFDSTYTVTAGNSITLKNPKIEDISEQTTI